MSIFGRITTLVPALLDKQFVWWVGLYSMIGGRIEESIGNTVHKRTKGTYLLHNDVCIYLDLVKRSKYLEILNVYQLLMLHCRNFRRGEGGSVPPAVTRKLGAWAMSAQRESAYIAPAILM